MNICALSHLLLGAPSPFPTPSSLLFFFLFLLRFNSWQTNSLFWSCAVSWCCFFSQLTAQTHTSYTPRGELLTQIQTHQSRPLWNDGDESQVNVRPRDIYAHTHLQTELLFMYMSLLISAAPLIVLEASTTPVLVIECEGAVKESERWDV